MRKTDSMPDVQLVQALESMKLKELIEYVVQNPNLREYISRIMTSKYKINECLISIRKPGVYRPEGMYLFRDNHYYIVNLDLAMEFVENFGELATKLKFDPFHGYDETDERNKQLLELINEHCSNLLEVELPMQWSNLLIKPFENVKKVTIGNYLREKLDLNRLFPSMEELRLYNVEGPDSSFIVQHYPKLKRFFSFFYYEADPFAEEIFEENPQITSLDVQNDESFEFLQRVSRASENIETLYFYPRQEYFERKSNPMVFNNVKNFVIETVEDFVLPDLPFIFNKIESLTYDDYYPIKNDDLRLPHDWYKVIPNNQNLKVISMPKTRLTTETLIDYSIRFPNLNSLSFKLSADRFDDALIQFLEDTQIKSITITRVPIDISSDTLAKKLPGKWNYQLVPEIYRKESHSFLLEQNFLWKRPNLCGEHGVNSIICSQIVVKLK